MTNFKCRTDRTSQFAHLHSHFAAVGDPKRIALVAADLVAHFEKRVEATMQMSNDEFQMSN